jgi:hypothetical protein
MRPQDMSLLRHEDLIELVRAGVAAPSADNRHAVRFEALPDGVRLMAELGEGTSAPSHRRAFHLIAHGAIIENIVRAGAKRGLVGSVKRYADGEARIADVTFEAGTPQVDRLADAIFERTTNRLFYRRGVRIPQEIRESIAEATRATSEVTLHWLDGEAERRCVRTMAWFAESERFSNQRLHRELFDAIRFDHGWHESVEEGIPAGALGVETPLRPFFRMLSRWPVQRALNAIGMARILGFRAAWLPIASAPHVVLLTAPEGRVDWIEAGRGMQRAWLCATSHGIALQPFAAPIAFSIQQPPDEWLPTSLVLAMRRYLARLAPGREGAMLMRLGYARSPGVRAGRRSPTRYLVDRAAR